MRLKDDIYLIQWFNLVDPKAEIGGQVFIKFLEMVHYMYTYR